ncbi:hypothetical protein CFBP1590__5010 [Pseudomonas viridiflava]|uniref:Uncharacterized protein n=1 Tax=Pseudomonas viridiflava TaxID=33069 RepID=A0A1Y6JRM0_PSEVI|nr:hypothetical protein CFBP1590__5010 [Pseudomonas viridiflava]VVM44846.1 hypothetical protein PS634_00485 [Pseudomonas fluorescens]VVN92414.1 hypothetical protein PS689_01996 [Pseudomonas fluorescens]
MPVVPEAAENLTVLRVADRRPAVQYHGVSKASLLAPMLCISNRVGV